MSNIYLARHEIWVVHPWTTGSNPRNSVCRSKRTGSTSQWCWTGSSSGSSPWRSASARLASSYRRQVFTTIESPSTVRSRTSGPARTSGRERKNPRPEVWTAASTSVTSFCNRPQFLRQQLARCNQNNRFCVFVIFLEKKWDNYEKMFFLFAVKTKRKKVFLVKVFFPSEQIDKATDLYNSLFYCMKKKI